MNIIKINNIKIARSIRNSKVSQRQDQGVQDYLSSDTDNPECILLPKYGRKDFIKI